MNYDLSIRLREAIDPVFDGSDGAAAERFVTAVRRRAFAAGKYNDKAWTAAYAATCLEGSAVRWYGGLDEEVQDDWRLLSQALLEQWPMSRRVYIHINDHSVFLRC